MSLICNLVWRLVHQVWHLFWRRVKRFWLIKLPNPNILKINSTIVQEVKCMRCGTQCISMLGGGLMALMLLVWHVANVTLDHQTLTQVIKLSCMKAPHQHAMSDVCGPDVCETALLLTHLYHDSMSYVIDPCHRPVNPILSWQSDDWVKILQSTKSMQHQKHHK